MVTKKDFTIRANLWLLLWGALILFVAGYELGGSGSVKIPLKYTDPFLKNNVATPAAQSPPNHCANEKLYDNLDDALIEVNNVCILDLSYQHLKVLPAEITKLSNLVELRLDNNELT